MDKIRPPIEKIRPPIEKIRPLIEKIRPRDKIRPPIEKIRPLNKVFLKNWVTESENNRHNREKFDCLELRSKFKNSLTKGVIITNILKQTNIPKYKIYETLKKHINNNELTEEQLSIICGINFKPKAKNFSKKRVRWLTVDILLIEFNF